MLGQSIVTDAILGLVVVCATVARIWGSHISEAELAGVYVYAIGYVTGRPVGVLPKPPV
jgi:hypothetical protein